MKKLIKAFGDKFKIIEFKSNDFLLYDTRTPGRYTNYLYLGNFQIIRDKYLFNNEIYNCVECLLAAITLYNSNLPFSPDVYNPSYRLNYQIEIAIKEYLIGLGFQHDYYGSYLLRDVYKENICKIEVRIKEDTQEGDIMRYIPRNDSRIICHFNGLNEAIACVNSIVVLHLWSLQIESFNVISRLTESRANNISEETFNWRTLDVQIEDQKQKMIEYLEKELQKLKGENV